MIITAITSVIQSSTVYQVTYIDGTIVFVPLSAANQDYIQVQKWIAAGGIVTQGSASN